MGACRIPRHGEVKRYRLGQPPFLGYRGRLQSGRLDVGREPGMATAQHKGSAIGGCGMWIGMNSDWHGAGVTLSDQHWREPCRDCPSNRRSM